MTKEKLKTLIKEYKKIGDELSNAELRQVDLFYENRKEEI